MQLNNALAEALGTGNGEEEEEEEEGEKKEESAKSVEGDKTENEDVSREEIVKKLIRRTVENLIQHYKKEVLKLMNEFRTMLGKTFSISL